MFFKVPRINILSNFFIRIFFKCLVLVTCTNVYGNETTGVGNKMDSVINQTDQFHLNDSSKTIKLQVRSWYEITLGESEHQVVYKLIFPDDSVNFFKYFSTQNDINSFPAIGIWSNQIYEQYPQARTFYIEQIKEKFIYVNYSWKLFGSISDEDTLELHFNYDIQLNQDSVFLINKTKSNIAGISPLPDILKNDTLIWAINHYSLNKNFHFTENDYHILFVKVKNKGGLIGNKEVIDKWERNLGAFSYFILRIFPFLLLLFLMQHYEAFIANKTVNFKIKLNYLYYVLIPLFCVFAIDAICDYRFHFSYLQDFYLYAGELNFTTFLLIPLAISLFLFLLSFFPINLSKLNSLYIKSVFRIISLAILYFVALCLLKFLFRFSYSVFHSVLLLACLGFFLNKIKHVVTIGIVIILLSALSAFINQNSNSNNFLFAIDNTILYVPFVFLIYIYFKMENRQIISIDNTVIMFINSSALIIFSCYVSELFRSIIIVPIGFLLSIFAFKWVIFKNITDQTRLFQEYSLIIQKRQDWVTNYFITIELKQIEKLKKTVRKKLLKGDLKIDDYDTQIEKINKYLKINMPASSDKIEEYGLGIGPFESFWKNGIHSAKWYLVLGAPIILTYFFKNRQDFIIVNLSNYLTLILDYFVSGFFFGYFFLFLKGNTGWKKGLYLGLVTQIISIITFLLKGTEISQDVIIVILQKITLFFFLGLIFFDIFTLKKFFKSEFKLNMVFKIEDLTGVTTLGSVLAASIGGSILAIVSGYLPKIVDILINNVNNVNLPKH
jgi:hypothetical protein